MKTVDGMRGLGHPGGMSFPHECVIQMAKMLRNLDACIEKAETHAKAKKFDPDVFVQAHLATDQYAFVKQVQAACDSAKFTAARLAGVEAPKHPDTETTLAQLRQRIRSVAEYVDGFDEARLQGGEEREVRLPFIPDKAVKGADYLHDMGLPNFYFHVATAYSILRNNGVDVGKRDFIGSVRLYDPQS